MFGLFVWFGLGLWVDLILLFGELVLLLVFGFGFGFAVDFGWLEVCLGFVLYVCRCDICFIGGVGLLVLIDFDLRFVLILRFCIVLLLCCLSVL